MKHQIAGVCLALLVGLFFYGLATAVFPLKARGHDEYSDWQSPYGYSCCSNNDCRPVTAHQDEDGNWIASVDGRPIKIPPDRVLSFKAKDGRSHWCGSSDYFTFCFTAGDVRS